MSELEKLPNIGAVAADNLRKIGVETAEQLREMGAEEAWLRIRLNVDGGACLHMLQGLAAAVEGIPKKDLSPKRKEELLAFFRQQDG